MAAGQGFIEFATGDVLTAASANGYLASQVVMVFASAAARTSAIASPQEGMISYLKDTNSTEYYSGSAWVAIGGGGLSSPLTTKGDVWGYSTTNDRIPVGTNGQVLTADSTAALGLKWATAASGSTFAGVRVSKSAAQSTANNTYTVVTWNTENFDTNTFHDNATNNSRLTVPSGKAGYYLVTGTMAFAGNATGYRRAFYTLNGVLAADVNTQWAANTQVETASFAYVVNLAVADYIEMQVYQSSGGSLNTDSGENVSFGMTYLGA